ncbi:MAG: hypothetical protein ACXV8G_16310 [Acidimicrobiales bacterium]
MPLSRSRRRLAAALVAVTLPLLAAVVNALRTPWRPPSDYALIALRTMDVPGHLPLDGVYSRFGFHHPGPALFLLYAVPDRLLGPTGLLVAAALINGAALAAAVVLLQRRGGAALLAIGTLGLVTLELAAAEQLADPWNPWVPMFPFALAILLAWSVWERDWWALPALAAVASFVLQAHLGYLVLTAWLLGTALAAVVVSWAGRTRARPCPPRVLAWSAAIGLAAWALPLWDLATGDPGNLREIADHFLHSTEPTVGWGSAARLLGRELGWVPPAIGGREPVSAFVGSVEGRSPLAVLPLGIVLAAGAVVAGRGRDWPPLRLLALVTGALGLAWVSIAHFEGDPYPYLVRWLWPLVVLGLVASAWAIQRALARHLAARADAGDGAPSGRGHRVASAIAVALVAVAALSATVAANRAPLPAAAFSQAVDHLAPPVAAAVRDRGTVLLAHQSDGWGDEEAGLVAELWRQGIELFVPDADQFGYGEDRTIGDRHVDGVLVVAIGDERTARRAGNQPAGSVLIASYDPLTADERAEADALGARAASELIAAVDGTTVADPLTVEQRTRLRHYADRGRAADVYLDPAP